MNKIVLLLTGCINPGEMPFTHLTNKDERMRQYKNAIDFYLHKTDYPIVFAENSNTDISNDYKKDISNGRLEIITFNGNDNKQRGKGYGEAYIIEYALKKSSVIPKSDLIVKITGRLIIENINDVIKKTFPLQKEESITCSFHSDLQFADSRIFCATKFFLHNFVNHKDEINDYQNIYFEHILAKYALSSKQALYPFWIEPLINGISGSTGRKYPEKEIDTPQHQNQYRSYVLKQVLLLAKLSPGISLPYYFFYKMLYIAYRIKVLYYHISTII